MIITTKKIKVYPNNKPWMSKAVKFSLHKKKLFCQGGISEREAAKKEVKVEILIAKQKYKINVNWLRRILLQLGLG